MLQNLITATATPSIRKSFCRTASPRVASVWTLHSKRSHCFVNQWDHQRVSWNTFTTSEVTRRYPKTLKHVSRNELHFTKRPRRWSAPMQISLTKWKRPVTVLLKRLELRKRSIELSTFAKSFAKQVGKQLT